MRRAFFIVIAIVAVVGIGLALYFFFTGSQGGVRDGSSPNGPQLPGGTPGYVPSTGGTSSTTGSGGDQLPTSDTFGVVAPNQVVDYFIDGQNGVTIIQPDGQIIKISNGSQTVLSSVPITGVLSAAFSYDGQKALVVFGSSKKPQTSVYDVIDKTWQPLPEDVRTPVWAPNGYLIAYTSYANNLTTIHTLDVSTKKLVPRDIVKLRFLDPVLFWPWQEALFISGKGSAFHRGSLFEVLVASGRIYPIILDKEGLSVLWDTKTTTGLMFGTDSTHTGGSLSLIGNDGVPTRNLSFITLPSKCAFQTTEVVAVAATSTATSTTTQQTTSLLCAVPSDSATMKDAPLPDAYDKRAFLTTDAIYKIQTDTGDVSTVFNNTTTPFDASRIKITRGRLFFINRIDNRLYGVALH